MTRDCTSMLVRRIDGYLSTVLFGYRTTLNVAARRRGGMKFAELIVEKPREAFQILVETLGSRESAETLLRRILENALRDSSIAYRLVYAIASGNIEEFRSTLSKWCSKLKS